MSPAPPPPPRRPPTYRTITEEQPRIVEAELTPAKSVAPGDVQLRGNGWRVNVPAIVLTGIISAFGARQIPAQSGPEAEARQEQRLEAMRNAEFRQEMREAMRQMEARLSRQEDTLHNYRAILEERLKRIEAAAK